MTLKRTGPPKRNKPLRTDPEAKRAFIDRGRSNAKPTRKPISPASPEQREKVWGLSCVVCGRDHHDTVIDPMHLIPRTMGSGNDPLDVVPSCREHHRAYDDGKLDLLPYLEPRWREEVAQAVRHVGLVAALQRLTNARWSEAA